ncbi:MAG: aminotransferase class V-fold PLP-dependent enzyme, partial [Desulfomonilia bacterium]
TIQPIEEIAAMARSRGILMHTDAAQSPGKVPVDVRTLGVDLLTVAGHKLYAPKGVGALYIREGVRIDPFMNGAGQERGRRAGTENVIGIVGLGMACEVAARDLRVVGEHLRKMRDLLHEGIVREIPDARLNGHLLKRLPNTLSLSFRGLDAGRILEEIGLDVAASAGAACHSEGVEISHVLAAMAVPEEWASGTLRLSTGRMTAEEEIRRAVRAITDAFRTLRAGK